MDISVTQKQNVFINAQAFEVLFGGAAGGGKSYGQIVDAFLFALKYKGSKQLVLRRTFPELEKSLIRTALSLYPKEVCSYNASKHIMTFINGSILDFGYCDTENDVYKYQSAEYDVIRFDEATHFTEYMYTYLISRCRGANSFPKHIKASTNPGGVGHEFFKKRFINIGEANQEHYFETGSRVFIPSRVTDNKFLLEGDPGYVKRLDNLSEKDIRALKYGDWDIFDGQYFSEFNTRIHVVEPFKVPSHWRFYVTMDYGFDMAVFYWIAVDECGRAYVTQEFTQGKDSGGEPLLIGEAARMLRQHTSQSISAYLAPPDLWNGRQDSGKSAAQIFRENGVLLTKTSNSRVSGWLAVKEWLHPFSDIDGKPSAKLRIFSNCNYLINTLPALQYSSKNPSDVSNTPHNITHGADALRGFCAYWTLAAPEVKEIERNEYNPLDTVKHTISTGRGERINVI